MYDIDGRLLNAWTLSVATGEPMDPSRKTPKTICCGSRSRRVYERRIKKEKAGKLYRKRSSSFFSFLLFEVFGLCDSFVRSFVRSLIIIILFFFDQTDAWLHLSLTPPSITDPIAVSQGWMVDWYGQNRIDRTEAVSAWLVGWWSAG